LQLLEMDSFAGRACSPQRRPAALGHRPRSSFRARLAALMDEPLSNLDAKLREQMRVKLGLCSAG
jgi:ABC-type sugar transport system ATPase subunit